MSYEELTDHAQAQFDLYNPRVLAATGRAYTVYLTLTRAELYALKQGLHAGGLLGRMGPDGPLDDALNDGYVDHGCLDQMAQTSNLSAGRERLNFRLPSGILLCLQEI